MKSFSSLIVLGAALTACSDNLPVTPSQPRLQAPAGVSAAVLVNESQDSPFFTTNPCTGEQITGELTYHILITGTESGSERSSFHYHINLQGFGETETGARYVVNESFNAEIHQEDAGPQTILETATLHFNRQGSDTPEDDLLVHLNVRVIFDPASGMSEFVRNIERVECH